MMATAPDYGALRALALDAGGDEEAVTVNTRALIDKVLARYSGEWTTLRELLQNAADASASKVIIRYETLPSSNVATPRSTDPSSMIRHVCSHHTLRRLVVSNDGHPFEASDWSRLKRIAEGNPDETKIGAFGVGFYSVFADCEEPFVRSGGEALAFYWKGNSLFTRRLQIPPSQTQNLGRPLDTTFVLDYRSTGSPLPGLVSLTQFLATSLTFVNLQAIELWIDDWKILTLTKKVAPGLMVPIPKSIETKTKEGIMEVVGVQREMVQIDACWMRIVGWKPPAANSWIGSSTGGADTLRGFFSRLAGSTSINTSANNSTGRDVAAVSDAPVEDLTASEKATIFLHMTTADIRSTVAATFAKELERATKKPPPRTTKLSMLTSLYNDPSSDFKADSLNVFAGVLPKTSGRVFIGFPTAQTTGLLAHISAASVIPTVERESIDLNARHVRTWNVELLRATGILCRICWACEMDALGAKVSPNPSSIEASIAALLPEAIHIFNQFTFGESTPSSQISQILEEAFWTSSKQAFIEVFCSRGVYPSHKVRLPTEEVSGFVQGLPVIPKELADGAKVLVKKLKDYGLLSEITFTDVQQELENKTLDEQRLRELLKWCSTKMMQGTMTADVLQSLMSVAIATVNDKLVVLRDVKYFINASRIPVELPHPPETAPFSCTKSLSEKQLVSLGWRELQIVPWVKHIVEQSGGRGTLPPAQDITMLASFSAQVLPVISKNWESLSQSSKSTVVGLLVDRTVIPTKLGMRKPAESYFPSVKLFPDLPVVSGLSGVKDKFLIALGVRKTIELGIIFDKLLVGNENSANSDGAQAGKWSHVELIRYLASVAADIPAGDIERLRGTAICPAEDPQDATKPTTARYRAGQLYAPQDDLRGLGFAMLRWPAEYKSKSPEGNFLTNLGLRSHPSLVDMIAALSKAAVQGDAALHGRLLAYYIKSFDLNGYSKNAHLADMKAPFLPLEGHDFQELATPADCFVNERCAIFGCRILRKDLHPHASKFGVNTDPPVADCVDHLIRIPPATRQEAKAKFAYLSKRVGEMAQLSFYAVRSASIVPIIPDDAVHRPPATRQGQRVRYQTPESCFLGDSGAFGEIFDFVDFGPEANTFLSSCGAKNAPNDKEIAMLIAREPNRVLGLLESAEKYQGLLRKLAVNLPNLKRDKHLMKLLKRSQCLLASRDAPVELRNSNGSSKSAGDESLDNEEHAGVKEWSLAVPGQIAIVDDYICYSLFRDRVLIAPQEEMLEDLYCALGSPSLSSLVIEEPRIGLVAADQEAAKKLQKLVYERSRLLLHDHPADAVQHDSRWLEKNLHVEAVHSISLRRSLRDTHLSHTETRTAAITNDARKGWTLWITAGTCDMFQVSQALVQLLLIRPKAHSAMMLEMFLVTDLQRLRRRGYNVDRIIRARAAEARIAEEQRRKHVEEERQRLQEEAAGEGEVADQAPPAVPDGRPSTEIPMPGTFTELPRPATDTAPGSSRPKKVRGLFSSIGRRLGLEDSSGSTNSASNPSSDPPPPYAPRAPGAGGGSGAASPEAVQTALSSAIRASRPHDSASVFSRPNSSVVQESSTYCDARPGQDISLVGQTAFGVKVFLASAVADRSSCFEAQTHGWNAFATVLCDCARIVGASNSSIHIFYDEQGNSVAFNRQGSLFFNYRIFKQLHLQDVPGAQLPGWKNGKGEALIYWFVVLCHELAHNLVKEHSSEHSFWTESFVIQYFSKVIGMLSTYA